MRAFSAFIFEMLPSLAVQYVNDLRCGNFTGLDCFLREVMNGVHSWLYENRSELDIFIRLIPNASVKYIKEHKIEFEGISSINDNVESKYVSSTSSTTTINTRMKILASVDAIIQYELLNISHKEGNISTTGWTMFFLFRSLAQFSSRSLHIAGAGHINSSKRGGERTKPRAGMLALIQRACPGFPDHTLSARAVWDQILAIIESSNGKITCNGSTFIIINDELSFEPSLQETRRGSRQVPIKFNTFRATYGKFKRERGW